MEGLADGGWQDTRCIACSVPQTIHEARWVAPRWPLVAANVLTLVHAAMLRRRVHAWTWLVGVAVYHLLLLRWSSLCMCGRDHEHRKARPNAMQSDSKLHEPFDQADQHGGC